MGVTIGEHKCKDDMHKVVQEWPEKEIKEHIPPNTGIDINSHLSPIVNSNFKEGGMVFVATACVGRGGFNHPAQKQQ